jgi:pyruvate-ferredoxin/flavodoxin oxidoreductase
MTTAMQNQKAAVNSAQWLLYRYNPDRIKRGENPLQLDSQTPRFKVEQFLRLENRFKMLTKTKPHDARKVSEQTQHDADTRWQLYQYLASRDLKPQTPNP